MKSKLVTPHAAFLIWNYNDRVNANGGKEKVHEIEQVVIGTSSIVSMSTGKTKSSAAGTFEVRLAPRFNWVSRITPGSWCAILMSQNQIPEMKKFNIGTVKPDSFKMLGRIDSIRGVVEVDQATGARRTSFIITGQDWGSVFESNLYIDTAVESNPIGKVNQAYSILGINTYATYADKKKLPSTSDLIDSVINLWGLNNGPAISNGELVLAETGNPTISKLLLGTKAQFELPKEVAQFMEQGVPISKDNEIPGSVAVNFATLIHREHGVLKSHDDIDKRGIHYTKVEESLGIPNIGNFLGQHTLWQLLNDCSNNALYEIVNDVRWDSSGKPKFTLYHRIRPFVTREKFMDSYSVDDPSLSTELTAAKSTVNNLISLFQNVRRIEIKLEDVVGINFGTNWRDKINFIEVRPTSQLSSGSQAIAAKLKGQTLDVIGYSRDGFKPLFVPCAYLPIKGSAESWADELSHWKWLLREWHFNTHMMLNGSVTFIGQNKYIQVGDNILIDSSVLGQAPINNKQKNSKNTFLLAHVENISHNFTVNQETGARTFSTTVQFVRGIISDKSGQTISTGYSITAEAGAIDRLAESLDNKDKRNRDTFGTSVESDPDVEKLGKGGLT